MASSDPIEQLRLGARAFLDAAATREVRRIVLLDAPAVLPVEVRRRLASSTASAWSEKHCATPTLPDG